MCKTFTYPEIKSLLFFSSEKACVLHGVVISFEKLDRNIQNSFQDKQDHSDAR